MRKLLGKKVKDRITGFEGIVTGQVEYLTGCNQVLVIAKATSEGVINSIWLDEQRIEVIDPECEPIRLNNSQSPGPDMAPPIH
jgi:hypothetical protein